ncbi:hypothetical protein F66182_8069 [Fusarium sp. NRRL 66182]|nr:hypothetical protein F66182_8069 [Fusarium sp. NRRL 66182]
MAISYIDLEEEERAETWYLSENHNGFPKRRRRLSSCTMDEDRTSDSNNNFKEVIDLTAELGTSGHCLLNEGEFALEKIRMLGAVIQSGSFIQVREFLSGNYLVEFVLVKIVLRCPSSGAIKIRGTPFARARSAMGKIPKKSNEVCMLYYFDQDDVSRSQEFIDIHLSDKLEVSFTGSGNRKKQLEEALVHIHSSDVHEAQYRVSDEVLRNRWRGNTVKGGAWAPSLSTQNHSIDLDSEEVGGMKIRSCGQKYTMFDSCSGAGGVSRGALMAGFKVQYAIDKAPEVWSTYQTNFPDTELFRMSLDEFLLNPSMSHMRVDVLHFSPPCQFFSPAHTHAAAHDDENIFALYGCNQLLKKLRPRIITVEQTFGLTHGRHEAYFNGFLGDFTQHGYSVRWRVVRLCTWGAAQDRKRLIIIAAAPGEKLPPFPKPTHDEDGQDGLLPYTTIGKAIRSIRPGDDLHNLDSVRYFNPHRAPYDPNRLAGTITTGGSDLYYPDGTRNLTLRELASIQGFPKTHKFLGTVTSIRRQIGNAFPPNTVRVLYKHIEQWLLRQDSMLPYGDQHQNAILIEDDSDASANLTDDSEDEPRHSPDMTEGNDAAGFGDQQHQRDGAHWAPEDMVIDLT